MRLPILYSISWPHRVPMKYKPLDLVALGSLTFKAPDNKKYPCIQLAYAAGALPCFCVALCGCVCVGGVVAGSVWVAWRCLRVACAVVFALAVCVCGGCHHRAGLFVCPCG